MHCGLRSLYTCHSIVFDTLIWQLQSYAAQQRGPDVHMSDARLVQADRRADRRGRGSRDRADVRRQRFDDPADSGRYAQVHTSSMLPMHNIMCEVCYTDLPTFAQTD